MLKTIANLSEDAIMLTRGSDPASNLVFNGIAKQGIEVEINHRNS